MRLPKTLHDEFVKQVAALEVASHHHTGSRQICPKHADADSDWDVVCLVKQLPRIGEAYCGAENPYFESIKIPCDEGVLNIIATEDETFFRLFRVATDVAQWLNLTERTDRVNLFRIVLYGMNVRPPVGLNVAVCQEVAQ